MSREDGRRVTRMADNKDFKDVGFYNAQDGLKGRDGGPYLDHVNRQYAEINRARIEGREPDDLNGTLPADSGTQLVPAEYVIDNSLTSNPSMRFKPGGIETVLSDRLKQDGGEGKPYGPIDEVSIASPVVVVSVDQRADDGVVLDDNESVQDTSSPTANDVAPKKVGPPPVVKTNS